MRADTGHPDGTAGPERPESLLPKDAATWRCHTQDVDSWEAFVANRLPLNATSTAGPGGIAADIDVHAQARVRPVSPDRRDTQFPRVRVSAAPAEGRRGVGWVA